MPFYLSDGGSGIRLIPSEYNEAFLMHYRTEGSKNGIRLYQNKDGSLTPLGRIHYGIGEKRVARLDKNIERQKADVEKANKMADQLMINKHNIADDQDPESKSAYKTLDETEKQIRNYVSGQNAKISKLEGKREKVQKDLDSLATARESKKDSFLDRFKALYLPPEMRGKSKEEIAAWEKAENEKFDLESKKERAEINFGKQLQKFDKLDSATQDEVIKNVEARLDELHAKKLLNHDERKIEDGLKDWLFTSLYNKRKEAEKVGKERSDERIVYLNSLPDGPEKAKAIEDILKSSAEASEKRYHDFTEYQEKGYSWTESHQRVDSKSFANPDYIELTNLESWLSGQISTKSGDWYWTTGVSDGFKKITNRIEDLQEKEAAIYNNIFDGQSSGSWKKLNEKYEKDPQVIQIKKEIDDLTAQMPAQVLKDLGVPVNETNIERIKPFVFWD